MYPSALFGNKILLLRKKQEKFLLCYSIYGINGVRVLLS